MSVRRFDVKGSLGVGILEWFDDYFKFTRTSDSQILEVTIHTSEGEIFGFQQVRELTDPPPRR